MNNTVLIIDDEEEICMLLSGMLRGMGYEAACASNLRDGLRRFRELKPKLAFVDLNLPDGSGFSALSRIKAESPTTKLIVISAYDGVAEKDLAKKHGAEYFMPKPFNKVMLKEAMEKVAVQQSKEVM